VSRGTLDRTLDELELAVGFAAAEFPGLLELPLGGCLCEELANRYETAQDHAVERIESVLARRDEAGALGVPAGFRFFPSSGSPTPPTESRSSTHAIFSGEIALA
jgi:hypothetical protein